MSELSSNNHSLFPGGVKSSVTPWTLVFERLDRIKGLKELSPHMYQDAKTPDWLDNVILEVVKVYLPGVKVNKETSKSAFFMGALMGHQMEMARQMTPERVALLQKFTANPGLIPPKVPDKLEASPLGKKLFEATMPAIDKAAKEAVVDALNLPAHQRAEFMRGMHAGINGATFESYKAHREFTTPVYLTLIYGWQEVVKLGSATELRNWLLQRLPAMDVGSESRIRKMCSRIGIKFRGRGRPRKTEK